MTTYRIFGRRDALSGVLVPVVTAKRLSSSETQHAPCDECGQHEQMWQIDEAFVCGGCCETIGRLKAGRYSEVIEEERA